MSESRVVSFLSGTVYRAGGYYCKLLPVVFDIVLADGQADYLVAGPVVDLEKLVELLNLREKDARDLGSETIDTNCHSGPLPRQSAAFSQVQLSCAAVLQKPFLAQRSSPGVNPHPQTRQRMIGRTNPDSDGWYHRARSSPAKRDARSRRFALMDGTGCGSHEANPQPQPRWACPDWLTFALVEVNPAGGGVQNYIKQKNAHCASYIGISSGAPLEREIDIRKFSENYADAIQHSPTSGCRPEVTGSTVGPMYAGSQLNIPWLGRPPVTQASVNQRSGRAQGLGEILSTAPKGRPKLSPKRGLRFEECVQGGGEAPDRTGRQRERKTRKQLALAPIFGTEVSLKSVRGKMLSKSQTGDVRAIIGEEPLGTPSVNVTGPGLYH
ncbi:hypothetical protein FB451DRAFT_1186695 [Mycena latifolia]|nr:hypothetical protein FB451DRAFT_1186695 [Mycena latifolia]